MRKELGGVLVLFLVALTLVSLLTFSPYDPSINHAGGGREIHNFFGIVGAFTAGILLSGFGIGAFWIPFLLLMAGLRLLKGRPAKSIIPVALGGLLLVVATGGLFSLGHKDYHLFGTPFPAGGVAGGLLGNLLFEYMGKAGGMLTAFLLFLVGLMVATGFSPVRFLARCREITYKIYDRIYTFYIIRRERRLKAKKLARLKEKHKGKADREIVIKPPPKQPAITAPKPKQEEFDFMAPSGRFELPSVKLLNDPDHPPVSFDDESLQMQARLLEKKLEDFGINGEVTEILPGPVITTFEYKPAPGVKINRIVSLSDDLALALKAISVRIVAPIPGKSVIGIEIPNSERRTVFIKEIIVSKAFEQSKSKLTLCLGKDIVGEPVVVEMDKMPHLLIAGSTGSGKSVALNTMICSLLYKATPDEVKLLMIDPKRIELSLYDGIPHLITPVVTNMKMATNALGWAVREMERRYELLAEEQVRNINQYNRKLAKKKDESQEKLPFIVIIIDEFADLMAVASRDVELALTRLAQMARAAGIHLILATQRPSVNVITGLIKANFPTRISFQVSSKIDSRTILDTNGAETLLGSGDMLYLPPGTGKLMRIHGAYISEEEVSRITAFLKKQEEPKFDESVTKSPPKPDEGQPGEEEYDELYDEAVALVAKTRQASISMIQRHLRIGYNRAARIIEIMEREGVVGPSDGAKPREVLISDFDDMENNK